MLNILILGATGTFGSVLSKKLSMDNNCNLTLFSRHIKNTSPNINTINGDGTNKEDLSTALKNQDVVYCAISGEDLPKIAQNLVELMPVYNIQRLIFMGAVGIYNEIPNEMDGKDNVINNPDQIPNKKAVDIVENSNLNYTIIRPGYLQNGEENDFVTTLKGEPAKGYISTIPSVLNLAINLIFDKTLYSRESVSITKNMEI